MITEDYVSFETAKLLKERRFDNDVICTDCWYDEDGDLHRRGNYSYSGAPVYHKDTCCNAPTLQMAMKWLREVHKIHIVIYPYGDYSCDNYQFDVYKDNRLVVSKDDGYITYEETTEAAIKYCLKNLI